MPKSIFVTGAAAGIGRATALHFAERGWFVGLFDVDERGLAEVAERVGRRSCVTGRLDVTDKDAFGPALAAFGAETGGSMDVLFNNAGILRMGRFEDIAIADYEKEVAINVLGVIYGIRAALPLLERGTKPCIVSMSSASALYGAPEMAVYSATKFAVRALTEALDIEFRKKKIRVCDVLPGYVDTGMVRSQTRPAQSLRKMGAHLTAELVAERVWDAVHGRGVHFFLEEKMVALARVGGAFPGLARRIMRHYSKAD
jgi:NAD(P)-dependent dehydrogenase (short-subunit alcohol dehydrogenase family)